MRYESPDQPGRDSNSDLLGRCAVVVASCDSYSDTWGPYDRLFERFWPDCPFAVYLVTNEKRRDFHRIHSLPIGKDVSWSDNLLTALSRIPQEFIILMVDDLFFTRPARTAQIRTILGWMNGSSGNCVHLYGRPRPVKPFDGLLGTLPKGTYYRASAVSSLWRKSVLMSILKPQESAWDFEIQGSRRSNAFDGFYSVVEPIFTFVNGLIKGKWHPRAVAELVKLGVTPETQNRGILNRRRRAELWLISLRSRVLSLLPLKMRGYVKDFILGADFTYRPYSS
jgi:hypothetical protein